MGIYKRDYSKLTDEEKKKWKETKAMEIVEKGSGFTVKRNLFRKYPKAVRHYLSLFPNNYLDIEELQNKERLSLLVSEFGKLINDVQTTERDILNFINKESSYFIIGSILKDNYNFGHHDAFIFPEFKLGVSYKADYLLIGKNSGGYEFVFVELEAPYGNITTKEGIDGIAMRKGIKQVRYWKKWIQSNYVSLKEIFDKYKNPQEKLPDEFLRLDINRIHYAIVAGRRKDFTTETYDLRREMKNESQIMLLHYDNLYDSAKNIIGMATY